MGTWVSKNGVQVPAREKVALVDPKTKEPFIYDGPDRSATEYLKEQGVTHLGRSWWEDPEVISRIRQIHNCSVQEYKQMMGYDEKTTLEKFEADLKKPVVHDDPKRTPSKKSPTGGTNTAGSGHYEGGFGDLHDAKATLK